MDKKKDTLHHTSSGDPEFDPVPAIARLIHELRGKSPDTPLGTFVDEQG